MIVIFISDLLDSDISGSGGNGRVGAGVDGGQFSIESDLKRFLGEGVAAERPQLSVLAEQSVPELFQYVLTILAGLFACGGPCNIG